MTAETTTQVFVYGTLKRGGVLHDVLQGQRFVGVARTCPDYRMYNLGWYPGLIEAAGRGCSISGEVWEVDADALRRLDEVEDVASGLYERRTIRLLEPFDTSDVAAWFYLGDVSGCADCGEEW